MKDKTFVFIIEDNKPDALLIENMLNVQDGCFTGASVCSMHEALARLKTIDFHPHAILLNLNLPDCSGFHVKMTYGGNITEITNAL